MPLEHSIIFGLEFLPVILQAAEEKKAPVLLQINPVHYPWMDLPAYVRYVKDQRDFQRLKEIADATSVPLVLHGGSGISDNDLRRGISLGICKINIYTEMSVAASGRIRELAGSSDRMEYPSLLLESRASVKAVVVHKLRTFGSSGKA